MPYQILKKGKEYVLKSPTKQYKHKTLAKAKAQKRLLEEKEGKVVQTQKVSQKVTVIVNAPKRRAGQARKQTVPQAQTIIQMRPVVPSNPMEAYYGTARPQPRSLLSGDEERIKSIEENIRQLQDPFRIRIKQEPHLNRVPSRPVLDTDFFNRELEEFMKIPDPKEKVKDEPPPIEYDLTKPIFQDKPIGGGASPSRERSNDSDATQPMSPFPDASVTPPGRYSRENLQRMTVLQLRQILKDRGETIGKKNKSQLIDAVMA